MKTILLSYALALTCSLSLDAQHTEPAGTPASTQAAQGKLVFEMNCSVGYCHGLEGRAGKGPRLRDRVWSKTYLQQTVEKGIPNSSMPAWQGRLARESIDAVVSYILSISHEQTSQTTADDRISVVKARPVLEKDAALGKAFFFDPLKDRNCGLCHRAAGSGTPVAAGFSELAKRPDDVLLRQIEEQPTGGEIVRVKLKSGDAICGTKASETDRVLHLYDLGGAGPPVLRTIDRDLIVEETPCADVNVHSGNSRSYTTEELADIVIFLRSME